MNAHGLHFIRVSDEQVVLRRGLDELLVSGPEAATLVEPLVRLLQTTRDLDEVVAAFTGPARASVEALLRSLRARRLIDADGDMPPSPPDDGPALQQAFFATLRASRKDVAAALAAATVAVQGINLISRALVGSLLEIGVGKVVAVSDPILDNRAASRSWRDDVTAHGDASRLAGIGGTAEAAAADARLLVAVCDFGRADALLEANRAAVGLERPFLPAWLQEFTGHVGPLTYPGETACLRCYALRHDANDPRHVVSAAVRWHQTNDDDGRGSVGMLPPMPAVVGQVAAMEVVKFLVGTPPSDAVGRSLELDVVTFRAVARRVLKVPRCPDCGEVANRGAPAVMLGPQISGRWAGLHT
jgi:bacteriocin biosynthesis cyclodehydratase domain-containing protein